MTKEKLLKLIQDYRKWQLLTARVMDSGRVLMFNRIPTFTCKDGFMISIQAGSSYFSTPQEDLADWEAFDIAIYTDSPEPNLDREERQVCDTFTVYGFTPINNLIKVINHHGGFRDLDNLKQEVLK